MEKTKIRGLTDMTVGSPAKHILAFSMPLLVGNLFQQLYNMVDSVVVGRFVGKTALAAVGTAFPVVFMLSSLFMGLGIGAMVMISQFYGANDSERVKKTIDTLYTGLIVGIVPLTILGILLCEPILALLNVPPDTIDESRTYMLIILGGLVASLGYNANAGILQGLGDSKTPLLFLIIASVINIVLDLLFVIVFSMGVEGVAIATVIAQSFSWIFGVAYINIKYKGLQIKPFCMRFDKELFKKIVKLGVPAGLQQALFSVGVMAMQRLVNSYGSSFIAGFNGANKIDMFAFMPIQSFSTAATTFVGQNIGAGLYDRVKKGTTATLLLGCAFSVATLAILLPLGPVFMRMFSDDTEVINAGMAYLVRILPFYSMLAISFALNSIMRGAGEMNIPLISAAVSLWLARVPSAYILAHFFGGENMHYCYAVGWVIGLLITVPYFISGRWKKKSVI